MKELLNIESIGDIFHAKIMAETLFTSEKIRSIRKTLLQHVESNPKARYIINLENVDNAGSEFLSMIALIQIEITENNCSAKFVNINSNISEILELSGISKILDMHVSIEKALMSFNQEMFNSKS